MEISKMLTISTAHITEETANKLDREINENIIGLCVYEKTDFGWFIHVPDDLEEVVESLRDLCECLLLAKDLGCEWLCLDCDGEVLSYLDTYEWQEKL